jgi:hypothetical protein
MVSLTTVLGARRPGRSIRIIGTAEGGSSIALVEGRTGRGGGHWIRQWLYQTGRVVRLGE